MLKSKFMICFSYIQKKIIFFQKHFINIKCNGRMFRCNDSFIWCLITK